MRVIEWTKTVENENHCDFVKLREMLIRTNMEDMREKTHTRHYELYRQKRLEQMGFTDVDSDNKPVSWPKITKKHLSMCFIFLKNLSNSNPFLGIISANIRSKTFESFGWIAK